MKTLVVIILITIGVTLSWERFGREILIQPYTINKETLDFSVPFSDTIDVELLKEFKSPVESTESL